MATSARLIHIKGNIYRMVDLRGRGYYWYVKCPTGYFTYHQTLEDAEDAEKAAQVEGIDTE